MASAGHMEAGHRGGYTGDARGAEPEGGKCTLSLVSIAFKWARPLLRNVLGMNWSGSSWA